MSLGVLYPYGKSYLHDFVHQKDLINFPSCVDTRIDEMVMDRIKNTFYDKRLYYQLVSKNLPGTEEYLELADEEKLRVRSQYSNHWKFNQSLTQIFLHGYTVDEINFRLVNIGIEYNKQSNIPGTQNTRAVTLELDDLHGFMNINRARTESMTL